MNVVEFVDLTFECDTVGVLNVADLAISVSIQLETIAERQ